MYQDYRIVYVVKEYSMGLYLTKVVHEFNDVEDAIREASFGSGRRVEVEKRYS